MSLLRSSWGQSSAYFDATRRWPGWGRPLSLSNFLQCQVEKTRCRDRGARVSFLVHPSFPLSWFAHGGTTCTFLFISPWFSYLRIDADTSHLFAKSINFAKRKVRKIDEIVQVRDTSSVTQKFRKFRACS